MPVCLLVETWGFDWGICWDAGGKGGGGWLWIVQIEYTSLIQCTKVNVCMSFICVNCLSFLIYSSIVLINPLTGIAGIAGSSLLGLLVVGERSTAETFPTCPMLGGRFPTCWGTVPTCWGTFPTCWETVPTCWGTFPTCWGTFPVGEGTFPVGGRLLFQWSYSPQWLDSWWDSVNIDQRAWHGERKCT